MNKEVIGEMFSRKRVLPLLLFVGAIVFMRLFYNKEVPKESPLQVYKVTGETMGTYYDIRYVAEQEYQIKPGVDSLLNHFEGLLSNWIPTSEVSQLNQTNQLKGFSQEMEVLLMASKQVVAETEGVFDPTVGPLIGRWGFAEKDRVENPSQEEIDSLLQFVGFDKLEISIEEKSVRKPEGVVLNLSAIAKGYGCDILANHLSYLGLTNFKVEIGGEIVCWGKKPNDQSWKIGIETPTPEKRAVHSVVVIDDCSMATSGNYRNFFEVDGVKYAHTINPVDGKPVQREILSVSVIAANCMLADAYATAFMVMGLDKVKEFVGSRNDLDVFVIYETETGEQAVWSTEGMQKRILEI